MDKKRKKEAATGQPASQPAQAGPQAGPPPEPAGLPAGPQAGPPPDAAGLQAGLGRHPGRAMSHPENSSLRLVMISHA